MPKPPRTDRHTAEAPVRSVKEAVALLARADFLTALYECHDSQQTAVGAGADESQLVALRDAFRRRWGVLPLIDFAIIGGASAVRAEEILAGRWAVIPVFRFTQRDDVLRAWRRFDQAAPRLQPKVARAQRHRAIASWLHRSGYSHYEIACGHYPPVAGRVSQARAWRRAGPELATRQQTIDRVRDDIERYERDYAAGLLARTTRRRAREPQAAALTHLIQVWTDARRGHPVDPGVVREALDAMINAFLEAAPAPRH